MTPDISTKCIELNIFLGKLGLARTGGQAKVIIRLGEVKVNDAVETKNKRKLHKGDVVEYQNKQYPVPDEYLR